MAAVVAMDPAGELGVCGLAVLTVRSGHVEWYHGSPMAAGTFRWLGERVAEACPPGHRVIFVAEKDAFGPSIGRKLGIGVGAVQGLLVDLNAMEAGHRVDVASVTWRRGIGLAGHDRQAWKKAACEYAARRFTDGRLIDANAAEALCILAWYRLRAGASRAKVSGP